MKSFILCSLVLAVAAKAQPDKFIPLESRTRVTLGEGYKDNQLPFTECKFDSSPRETVCEVHLVAGQRCSMTFYSQAYVEKIHQIGNDKLLVISRQFERLAGRVSVETAITTMEMNVCLTTNDIRLRDASAVVPYQRNFYVVADHEITEYNQDGYEISSKPFSFDAPLTQVYPVSHSKNLFVLSTAGSTTTLALVDRKSGEVVKLLTTFVKTLDYASHSDESTFTICWSGASAEGTRIHCKQFDEFGEKTYSEGVSKSGFHALVDVRGLENGGVVLFTVSDSATKFHVTKKLPVSEAVSVSYDLPEHLAMKVMDFNEYGRSFRLAYESFSKKRGHGVTIRKFQLP